MDNHHLPETIIYYCDISTIVLPSIYTQQHNLCSILLLYNNYTCLLHYENFFVQQKKIRAFIHSPVEIRYQLCNKHFNTMSDNIYAMIKSFAWKTYLFLLSQHFSLLSSSQSCTPSISFWIMQGKSCVTTDFYPTFSSESSSLLRLDFQASNLLFWKSVF